MPQLTELETHRRLITAQIKREVTETRHRLRQEMLMRTNALESRLIELEKAMHDITKRLVNMIGML